jgi:hypothetical protein
MQQWMNQPQPLHRNDLDGNFHTMSNYWQQVLRNIAPWEW